MYGIYTTLMKKRIGDESRVDMTLFFGLVGLFNFIVLLPGFFVLHFTGIETFELPPTRRIVAIVLVSSSGLDVGSYLTIVPDQLSYLPGLRSLLGLLNATHLTSSYHSRTESDDTALANWPDD